MTNKIFYEKVLTKINQVSTVSPQKAMKNRVYYFDFIRAFAVCLIIVYHCQVHAIDFKTITSPLFGSACLHFGQIGVSLFIILSGASLIYNYEQSLNVWTYAKNRFLSIYPLFWVTYLIFFPAEVLIAQAFPNAPLLSFLWTIAGLDGLMLYKGPNFYVLGEWFLGLIIILYIIFPFLRIVFLKSKHLTLLICIGLILLITKYYQLGLDIQRFPFTRLLEFTIGMSFVYLFREYKKKALNLLLIGLFCILLYLTMSSDLPFLFMIPLAGTITFYSLAITSQLFSNAVWQKAVRFVSTYSYGAFLAHHVIAVRLTLLFRDKHLTFWPNVLLVCTCLILAFGISFILTHLTKLIVSKWKQRVYLKLLPGTTE